MNPLCAAFSGVNFWYGMSRRTWPDVDKRTKGTIQNKRRDYHFVNVPRSLVSITNDDCFGASQCLFKAIKSDQDNLKSSTGTAS